MSAVTAGGTAFASPAAIATAALMLYLSVNKVRAHRRHGDAYYYEHRYIHRSHITPPLSFCA